MKCRVPAVRLIFCLLDSSKGMDKDFLIVLGGWHDGMHCSTQEGELGSVLEDRTRIFPCHLETAESNFAVAKTECCQVVPDAWN